jgi:hypothetical protein
MSHKREDIVQKAFKNDKGEWALGAKPNLPLITWLVMLLLAQVLSGDVSKLASVIGRGALFTWAWLELFQGVNYFRRALGAIVIVFTVWTTVQH